jgi:hypothetical protein
MPTWDNLILTWEELKILPRSWKDKMSQWRGIYYILDASDGKGYVGAAYGNENILGRWLNYAASGHGGNKELRKRDPANFRFSILESLALGLDKDAVIGRENSWKVRLHTRDRGLNDN